MSLVPLVAVNSSSTAQGNNNWPASRRSSSLLHPKKYEAPCYCVEEADVEVFRGVFTQQWLRGRSYGALEPIFFCTTCGPPVVMDTLGEGEDKKSGKGGGSTPSGKDKTKNFFSKLFSKSAASSKKDLTAAGGAGTGSAASSSATSSFYGGATGATSGGGGGGSLGATGPRRPPHTHTRGLSAEEEQQPMTPRTERELFLCVTCGACYCRDHAADHHYSRRRSDDTGSSWSRANANTSKANSMQGYPHHSFYIGVPTYVSTHPSRVVEETAWGLLFPTVIMREVESGSLDLAREYAYFEHAELLLDELMRRDVNLIPIAAAASAAENASSVRGSHSRGVETSTTSRERSLETSPRAAFSISPSTYTTPVPDTAVSTSASAGGGGNGGSVVHGGAHRLPSHGLVFSSNGSTQWSYLCWCASCNHHQRVVRLSAKQYDDGCSRLRHLRLLGESLAILAYLCRRGVRLELPEKFVMWKAADEAAQRQRQMRQAESLSEMNRQRVGRATETADIGMFGSGSGRWGQRSGNDPSSESNSSRVAVGNGETVCLTRNDTDKVLSRACVCGFSNPSYLCYMNAVLQCVLRCTFFTRPIVKLRPNDYPGALTKSLALLLHHIEQQTYQDVRNGAVYPFVKSVFRQICRASSLFELDEQQDAQELLITLLNGVADEFDKGKNAEERSRGKRISFEGTLRSEVVCARCHHRVPRDEMFMSLSIPIKESVEEGIREVFAPAYLKGKDRYACEHCFTRMSASEQAAHNAEARRQQEEVKRLRALGKKANSTSTDPATTKTENCVYQEAEVRTTVTKLGGTLAVHLLRFHYDAGAGDFVKVARPVAIPLTIDLSSYVSNDVLESFNTERALCTLRVRFPTVDGAVLEAYLKDAGGDQTMATKQLLGAGYGVEEISEKNVSRLPEHAPPEPVKIPLRSSVGGDRGASPEGSVDKNAGTSRARPRSIAVGGGEKGGASASQNHHYSPNKGPTVPFAPKSVGGRGIGGISRNRPPIVGATNTASGAESRSGRQQTQERRRLASKVPAPNSKEPSVLGDAISPGEDDKDAHPTSTNSSSRGLASARPHVVGEGCGGRGGASQSGEVDNGDDNDDAENQRPADRGVGAADVGMGDSGRSVTGSFPGGANGGRAGAGGAAAGSLSGGTSVDAVGGHSHSGCEGSPLTPDGGSPPGLANTATAPPSAARSRKGLVTSSVSLNMGVATSGFLDPNQILHLKTDDFDPFGERSCPVVGGATGERRTVGGGKGFGRAPRLVRRLVGIVAHRGSLHGGHYIAYVRHLGRPEVWFRCDDEDVDIVQERTVLDCASEVYLAFYE